MCLLVILLKGGHGIFNMCKNLGACCTHNVKTGTEKCVQVLNHTLDLQSSTSAKAVCKIQSYHYQCIHHYLYHELHSAFWLDSLTDSVRCWVLTLRLNFDQVAALATIIRKQQAFMCLTKINNLM